MPFFFSYSSVVVLTVQFLFDDLRFNISLSIKIGVVEVIREPYKVRKQKNVWKFPYLWGGRGSDQGQFPYNF